jgi:hypothetical protein
LGSNQQLFSFNVNGFVAAALKTTSLTSVLAESDTPVVLERLKVAVSADEFGTVAGVQFSAVFQFAFVGLRFHAALPASASSPLAMSAAVIAIAASIKCLARNECEFYSRVGKNLTTVKKIGQFDDAESM